MITRKRSCKLWGGCPRILRFSLLNRHAQSAPKLTTWELKIGGNGAVNLTEDFAQLPAPRTMKAEAESDSQYTI